MTVIKRDGREVPYEKIKVYQSVLKIFANSEKGSAETAKNGFAEDVASTIALRLYYRYVKRERPVSTREVQADIETELMREGAYEAAKTCIEFRCKRQEAV